MPLGHCPDTAVERGDADEDCAAGPYQGLEDRHEVWSDRHPASDNLFCPALEPTDPFAEHDAKSLQQPSDLVLQPSAHAGESLARGQHRLDDTSIVALDLRCLELAGVHDLRQVASIEQISLPRHHLQSAVRGGRIARRSASAAP